MILSGDQVGATDQDSALDLDSVGEYLLESASHLIGAMVLASAGDTQCTQAGDIQSMEEAIHLTSYRGVNTEEEG